ncbi:MAG: DUF2339 domain-containing protein [Phycisphaerales bacterium]
MTQNPDELETLLRTLNQRLEKLEREMRQLKGEPDTPPVAPRVTDTAETFTSPPRAQTPPIVPSAPAPHTPGSLREMFEAAEEEAEKSRSPLPTPPTHPAPGVTPKPKLSIEMLVGGRALAAAGALILVVGFALLLKFAYDNGWLRVDPALRCSGGAGLGFLLIGVGEFMRKRWGAVAASGITSAGLGVLYTSVFAAYRLFGLVGPGVGFVLLAATAIFGVAVGARARLVVVAALSIIGGYLVPFFFAGTHGAVWSLPAHLLMLLAIGLVLAGWLRGPFIVLRSMVWWGTVVLGGAWAVNQLGGTSLETIFALSFLALAWAGIQAELMWSAMRGPLAEPGKFGKWLGSPLVSKISRWRPLVSSVSTTAWFVGIGNQLGVIAPDWVLPAGVCGLAIFASSFLAGMSASILERPTNDRQRLAAVYLIQGGAMLMLAVALAVSGLGQVLAWILLGVGAVLAGSWMRARAFDVYALTALSYAAGRLILFDSWLTPLPTRIGGIGPIVVSEWMIGMLVCALGWIGAGLLIRRSGEQRRWAVTGELAAAVGCFLVAIALQHEGSTKELVTGAFAFSLLLAGVLSVRLHSRTLRIAASFATAIAGVAAVLASWWVRPPWFQFAGLVFGEGTGAVALLAACLLAVWAVNRWWRPSSRGTEDADDRRLETSTLATLLLASAPMHVSTWPLAATVWGLLLGTAWLVHARSAPRNSPGTSHAAMVGAVGVVYWASACLVRRSPFEVSSLPPAMPVGVLLAAVSVWSRRGWGLSGSRAKEVSVVAAAAAVAVFFTATSFDVARLASTFAMDPAVRGSAVSIYWGIFAVALIASGFAGRLAWVRYAGLALIAIASTKAVVFDLGSVPQGWRIASFIGLGVLMLGVHFAYTRLSARLLRPTERNDSSGRPDSF